MIRKATLDDFKDIKELIELLENDIYDDKKLYALYENHIHSNIYQCLVYESDKILGYISYMIKCPLHHHKQTCEVLELCVKENSRGQHIGLKLLQYVENECKEHNIEEIELSSNIVRKDAHRFYMNNNYILDHYNFRKKL